MTTEQTPEQKPEQKPEQEPEGVTFKFEDDEGDALEPLTVAKAHDAAVEMGKRAKNAGLRPAKVMLADYFNNALSAVDGFLSALEGKRKSKDD